MVLATGVEPVSPYRAWDFKSHAYAGSATPALDLLLFSQLSATNTATFSTADSRDVGSLGRSQTITGDLTAQTIPISNFSTRVISFASSSIHDSALSAVPRALAASSLRSVSSTRCLYII